MPQDGAYPAGTNRSGAKRKRVTSTADSTASMDTAGGSADGPEAGSDQGERLLEGQQTGGNVQLLSDRAKTWLVKQLWSLRMGAGWTVARKQSSQALHILMLPECRE